MFVAQRYKNIQSVLPFRRYQLMLEKGQRILVTDNDGTIVSRKFLKSHFLKRIDETKP